ncbi:MAG: four helix bundle protein [Chloroflexi bacterium]|nr:four helix bundle protein [Chloroflexota bacterium]
MKVVRSNYQSPGKPGRQGFEELVCYRLALDVMQNAHHVARTLPADEKYDLVQQIRRSSKSVLANIAEGYGRYHYLDALRFYAIARGSLNETLSHFIVAKDLGYIPDDFFAEVYAMTREAEKTLNGLMNHVRQTKAGKAEFGERSIKEEAATYDADNRSLLEESPDFDP